jgi:hypothetical protein
MKASRANRCSLHGHYRVFRESCAVFGVHDRRRESAFIGTESTVGRPSADLRSPVIHRVVDADLSLRDFHAEWECCQLPYRVEYTTRSILEFYANLWTATAAADVRRTWTLAYSR